MTAHDAELLRILGRGLPEEERRRYADRIASEERAVRRRLTGEDDEPGTT